MMKTLSAAALGALILLQLACAQRPGAGGQNAPPAADAALPSGEAVRGRLKAQAEELGRAFVGGDFGKVADLTHPSIVELAGGKAHLAEDMGQVVEEMRAEGSRYESLSVGEPKQVVSGAQGRLFAVVPTVIRIATPRGVAASQSFFLGVSEDGGARWTFVEGADIEDKNDLKALFPSAPDGLDLPAQTPPALEQKP